MVAKHVLQTCDDIANSTGDYSVLPGIHDAVQTLLVLPVWNIVLKLISFQVSAPCDSSKLQCVYYLCPREVISRTVNNSPESDGRQTDVMGRSQT